MLKKIFKRKSKKSENCQINRVNISYVADKKRCANKVALVLGASSGIGKACAESLAHNGAKVILAARRENLLQEAVSEINRQNPNSAEYIVCDASKPDQIAKTVEFCVKKFGKIDIAVNNFGISGGQNITESTEDYYNQMMDTNVKGVIFAMKYQIAQMTKQQNTLSSIINIGSTLSMVGMENLAVYCASKHAVAGATRSVVLDRHPNLRINCVCPGSIRTAMFGQDRTLKSEYNQINNSKGIPIGHIGEPHEIASVVTFLASDEASFVNGAIIPVDGGFICN